MPSYRKDLGEPWDIAKIYWGAMSETRMRAGLRALRESGDTTSFEGMDPDGPLPPFVTADENLAAVVDARRARRQEDGGAGARTPPRSPPTGRSSRCPTTSGTAVWGIEFYRIAKGTRGELNEDGLETDLFAGL